MLASAFLPNEIKLQTQPKAPKFPFPTFPQITDNLKFLSTFFMHESIAIGSKCDR